MDTKHEHRYDAERADWWCETCETVTDFCSGYAEEPETTSAEKYAAACLADRLTMLAGLTPEQLERNADATEAGR